MTANKILNNFLEALKMSDGSPINYKRVVLDILKYLDYQESGGDADPNATVRQNDKLWEDITKASPNSNSGCPLIALPILRKILEKHKILEQERGM